METTEKIVESYCRYVKQWFTIPNVKCRGQCEIDLLAIDVRKPNQLARYHIECGVLIAPAFSKLTAKAFSPDRLRQRLYAPGQRRTIGFFVERKFNRPEVVETLSAYGFTRRNHQRVIVSWGFTPEAKAEAKRHRIEIWDFRDLLTEIAQSHIKSRSYFADDTARTIQLFAMAYKSGAPPS